MAKLENIRQVRKCQSYTNPLFWLAVNWLRYLKMDIKFTKDFCFGVMLPLMERRLHRSLRQSHSHHPYKKSFLV